jgi:hypothetical protein
VSSSIRVVEQIKEKICREISEDKIAVCKKNISKNL